MPIILPTGVSSSHVSGCLSDVATWLSRVELYSSGTHLPYLQHAQVFRASDYKELLPTSYNIPTYLSQAYNETPLMFLIDCYVESFYICILHCMAFDTQEHERDFEKSTVFGESTGDEQARTI